MNIHVYTDCTSAMHICNNRWSKTNDMLNKYLAYFDMQCSLRGILLQVTQLPREQNRGAHHLAEGNIQEAARYADLNNH